MYTLTHTELDYMSHITRYTFKNVYNVHTIQIQYLQKHHLTLYNINCIRKG